MTTPTPATDHADHTDRPRTPRTVPSTIPSTIPSAPNPSAPNPSAPDRSTPPDAPPHVPTDAPEWHRRTVTEVLDLVAVRPDGLTPAVASPRLSAHGSN